MAVQHAEGVLPNSEPGRSGSMNTSSGIIVVARHGDQRRDVGELFQHHPRIDIAEMHEQVDLRPIEEPGARRQGPHGGRG